MARLIGRPPPPRRSALVAAIALQQPVKVHGRGEDGRDPHGYRTPCGRKRLQVATTLDHEHITCGACRRRLGLP